MLEPGQDLDRLVDDVRDPFDEYPAAPALRAGIGPLRNQPRSGFHRDAAGQLEPLLA